MFVGPISVRHPARLRLFAETHPSFAASGPAADVRELRRGA